jgi:hypothetical protein
MTFPKTHTIDDFGGVLQDLSPVSDPTTDRPAAGANMAYGSVAAMTRTAGSAWVRLQYNPGAAPTVLAHGAAWGSGPAVKPTTAYLAVGRVTVTWPTTIVDETGATQTVFLTRTASLVVEGSFPGCVAGNITGPQTAQVLVFDPSTKNASDNVINGFYLEVG